jgi:hypothetical protein
MSSPSFHSILLPNFLNVGKLLAYIYTQKGFITNLNQVLIIISFHLRILLLHTNNDTTITRFALRWWSSMDYRQILCKVSFKLHFLYIVQDINPITCISLIDAIN